MSNEWKKTPRNNTLSMLFAITSNLYAAPYHPVAWRLFHIVIYLLASILPLSQCFTAFRCIFFRLAAVALICHTSAPCITTYIFIFGISRALSWSCGRCRSIINFSHSPLSLSLSSCLSILRNASRSTSLVHVF